MIKMESRASKLTKLQPYSQSIRSLFTSGLRLGLSHLNEHKLTHNFKNCVNPLCTRNLEIESTPHFFLHCNHHSNVGSTLLYELQYLNGNILKVSDITLINLILYGG